MGSIVSTIAFPYPRKEYSENVLRNRRDLKFITTSKEKLRIPIIHIKRFNNSKAKYTIIYSHGNAEDVGLSLNYLDMLSEILDLNIIAYEYPGYSISDGYPSEDNCYEAINAAYHYATTIANIDPSTIILFGRSLGTGPTVDLCSRTSDVAGCILQSPLESGIRCFIGFYSSYALYPIDIFRNYAKIEKIKCPVFILHGLEDNVVPCSNGKNLYKQLQERSILDDDSIDYSPLWIPSRGHNDIPEAVVMQHCKKFLFFLNKRRVLLK